MSEPPRVLITGASSGIGAALAHVYAERSARLVLIARDEHRLQAVGQAVAAQVVVGDVTDPATLTQAVALAEQSWGGLDVVIANAGYALRGQFADLSPALIQHQLNTNVMGVVHTIQAALPALRRSHGRVVIVGSVAGTVATPGTSAYAMSKAALRSLAEVLRMELADSAVSVTLLVPGLIQTDINQRDMWGQRSAGAAAHASKMAIPAMLAARKMQRAIDRRRKEAIITHHARAMLWLWRWLPGLVRFFLARRTSQKN